MANEDDVMAFEITDQDLDDEVNIEGRRPRMTKDQAIYGVWADNDEEEESRPTMGMGFRGASRSKGKASYTAPVGFVSAGIQGGDKEKNKKNEGDDPEEEDDEKAGASSEEDDSFRSGLGFGSSSKFGQTKPKGFNRQQQKKIRLEPEGQIAGLRTTNVRPNQSVGKGLGDWEKHTKGIGAKLLMQMGYEAGKGLGKALQGRSTIVEAHLRKGKGAIGFYGSEGLRKKEEKAVDSEEEEEKEFKEKLHQWKRGGKAEPKVKYVYKTADQVLEEGKWRKISRDTDTSSALGKVKVIDMTGREERVLSGYHAIAAQQRPVEEDLNAKQTEKSFTQKPQFEIPELLHNINLILDNCEEDLISSDRKLRHHRDRVEVLKQEEEKLSVLVEKERDQISTIQGVLDMVEKMEEMHKENLLDLDSALEMFHKMEETYPAEYRAYEIPHIASTIVVPLIKTELATWKTLNEPAKYRSLFLKWKEILALGSFSDDEENPFYILVWESWMPSARAAINLWSTRHPDPLIAFLNMWADVIPARILHNIKTLIILPKLQADVEHWNPMTDPVPIHTWLHPWLELLPGQLDIVYPTIRHKLAAALNAWHPSDSSARHILMPWRDVFDKGTLQAFLYKNIVPKLVGVLQTMEINPSRQRMDEWTWVMDWQELVPSAALASMLAEHFFPQWIKVLVTWLNHSPNYTEVTSWYQGWKSEMQQIAGLLDHSQVRSFLTKALEIMERAVSGGSQMSMQPGAFESIRYLSSREAAMSAPSMASASVSGGSTATLQQQQQQQQPLSFKDLVAKRCAERNILFAPIPGKTQEGKQVYRCGNTTVYLDRNVIRVHRTGMWIPESLNGLLDHAL